jgi:hypothetical protein
VINGVIVVGEIKFFSVTAAYDVVARYFRTVDFY